MWDCYVRVGGAVGTNLESKNCPASKTGISPNCKAVSALMHVTKDASGYFENVWLWVADYDIDDPNLTDDNNFITQCSVYVARGLLIESQTSSWYYGTSSEHSVLLPVRTLGGQERAHGPDPDGAAILLADPTAPGALRRCCWRVPRRPLVRIRGY